ncbi:DUF1905 domain-containing protein [Vibrio mexicanus]|uniref:DUF1905 domain-containing protein n=1 Tax=Vibrio mexicanus TaxID=1004326 RepID=UPI000A762DF3
MIKYSLEAELWKDSGQGGWHFITFPKALSEHIRMAHGRLESGWGRLRVEVSCLDSSWSTSLWYDTKSAAYLLPISAKIRKKHKLATRDKLSVSLVIEHEILL